MHNSTRLGRWRRVVKTIAMACLAALVMAGASHAQRKAQPGIALKLFAKSQINRSSGCSVALWQANRDPHQDKYAYIFFERITGNNHARKPAQITIGDRIVSLRRIATGGKNNGYKLYQYQLYKMSGSGNYVVLDLKLEPEEGEAVEISGGTMTIIMRGKKTFRASVKGGAGCMTAAAAPQSRQRSQRPAARPRHASSRFPGCSNPQGTLDKTMCGDAYLTSLNLQVQSVLNRFRRGPQKELPEWLQMEYAHQLIALEECNGKFRCIEHGLKQYIDQVTGQFLKRKASSLAKFTRVKFKLHQSQDSPGRDLISSKSPRNFGWSQKLCQLRCAATARCAAAGYDPLQHRNGIYGYCTMKSAVSYPLSRWRQQGVLLVKR